MTPDRISLIQTPTPLHFLPKVSEELNAEIWIKRDDLTGFALGGNKGRKLEFLMAEAVKSGATVVTSCGSIQSNFLRQLAVACRVCGMKLHATTMDLPFDEVLPIGPRLHAEGGNRSIDDFMGAQLNVLPNSTWEDLYAAAEAAAKALENQGEVVYRIPVGGSSPLGAYSFYRAGLEAQQQGPEFDWIVTASSSGSTQTGLAMANWESLTKVLGIAADPEPDLPIEFSSLSQKAFAQFGIGAALTPDQFLFNTDYVGAGYGVFSSDEIETIRFLASREGIFLDPIYSSKAFRGMMDLLEKQAIGGRILFWHTGGVPTLFAMPNL